MYTNWINHQDLLHRLQLCLFLLFSMKGDSPCRLEPAFLQFAWPTEDNPWTSAWRRLKTRTIFLWDPHTAPWGSLSSFPNLWTKKGVYLMIKLEVQDRFKGKTILGVCIYTYMDIHVKTHTYICMCMQWVIWLMDTCLYLIRCTNICIFATAHVEACEQKSSLLAFETIECIHSFCVAEHMAFKEPTNIFSLNLSPCKSFKGWPSWYWNITGLPLKELYFLLKNYMKILSK